MDFTTPEDSPLYDLGFGPIIDSPCPPIYFGEKKPRPFSWSTPPDHLCNDMTLPLTTFAYYRTTLNRIHADDLERGGRFDTHQWTPLFVTGALQLPGTLAYVLQSSSAIAMSEYMIPGKTKDVNPEDGTIVLGRGRRNRDMISDWYGEGVSCVDVDVDIKLADGAVRRMAAVGWIEECSSSDTDESVCEAGGESEDETAEKGDAEEGANDSGIFGCTNHAAQMDELGDGQGDGHGWTSLEANAGVVW